MQSGMEALKDENDSNESSMTNLREEDFEDTAAWNKYKAEKDAHEAKRAKNDQSEPRSEHQVMPL